ncbi:MAG: sensor histidine kinase [Caulobacteraceae bacterium]
MGVVEFADEETTLLAELNHRLFNTMQVIAAQVAQCSRADGATPVRPHLEALRDRIQALGALHRLLAYPACESFEEHCQTLCRLLIAAFDRSGVKAWVRMETVAIGRREERYLALLVVELVTNVLKHSLTEGSEGTLWIDLQVQRDGLELRVCDSRKAPVRVFGPPRMAEALARALGGQALVCDRDGYAVVVRFPEPDVQAVLAPAAPSVKRPSSGWTPEQTPTA